MVPATGDDGPVEPGQQIEQGGLARIGPPHDGTVHTLPQDSTSIVIPDEGVQLSLHGSQGGYQLGILQRGNVLLREIHPGSQMGLQGGQGILFSPDFLRQRAVQGGIGQRRTLSAIGRDQVHNGLGLGQPQLAVQEGAAGVLAGGGGAAPAAMQLSTSRRATALPPWQESSTTSSPV